MRKTKTKKYKTIRNLIVTVLIFITAYSFGNVLYRKHEIDKQIVSLSKQIEKESKTNKELKKEKSQLNTDSNYKKVARDTLGLVEPGDKIYVNSND